MKLKIKHKLLLLITLPTIALVIFSLNHFNDKYSEIQEHKTLLVYSQIIKSSSDLINQLQIERGLSSSYLINPKSSYFQTTLIQHLKKIDKSILIFKKNISNLDETTLSKSNQNYLKNINKDITRLKTIRQKIVKKEIKNEESFEYFTSIITNLLELALSFDTHSNNNETHNDTLILKKLLHFQELAGKERAFVMSLVNSDDISKKDVKYYNSLILWETELYHTIKELVKNPSTKALFGDIETKYKTTYFKESRDAINNFEDREDLNIKIYKIIGFGGMIHDLLKYKKTSDIAFYNSFLNKKEKFNIYVKEYIKITPKNSPSISSILAIKRIFDKISYTSNKSFDDMKIFQLYKTLEQNSVQLDEKRWFEISSKRIKDIHNITNIIIQEINSGTKKDLNNFKNDLFMQMLLTFIIIMLLLFGAILISRNITNSILALQNGVKDFFDFLNFKRDVAKHIKINSNDEIFDIAQSINTEIVLLEKNLEKDKDFINEATQIVKLMKNGDFSDKLYFEPVNPNLKDLKDVLNELIALITAKIKEQTNSLEELNCSLEDKVFNQTLELHNQVKELIIARDKALQAEVAKDEFLANMSHEIRTPLNAILGFVTILKKRVKDEKSLNYLKIIDSSGMSLLTIINDILDFSKIQSGKFTIFAYEINPLEEFSNSALLFASKVYEKHIVYNVYIDPLLPKTISVDAVRVKQVISNILSNAIKFTPEDGEIKLTVLCENNNLIITVKDSGIGISKENLSKVFSAFEQADNSTTRKYGGTGLGLSISSKLASLMGGTLSVESELNKGSTFTLSVPIDVVESQAIELIDIDKIKNIRFGLLSNCIECANKIALIKQYLYDFGAKDVVEINEFNDEDFDILFFVPDEEYNEDVVNASTPSIAMLRSASIKLADFEHIQPLYAPFVPKSIITAIEDTNVNGAKRIEPPAIEIEHNEEDDVEYIGTILVAEDNKTNQMLISLMLDDYGLSYTIANNGVEAVEKFKEGEFDMVLMDENMPELNGIGAMQQIKEYEKQKRVTITPIIALTACVLDSDKELFLDAGMDGFVAKPINNKMLEIEFNKYLKRR